MINCVPPSAAGNTPPSQTSRGPASRACKVGVFGPPPIPSMVMNPLIAAPSTADGVPSNT